MKRGLATFVLVSALTTSALWAISLVPPSNEYHSSPTEFLRRCSHWMPCATINGSVAYYTCWLTWLTGGLMTFALFQGVFIVKSNTAARRAADAAKSSVDFAVATERAYLTISGVEFSRDANYPAVGPGGYWAKVLVTNDGRTPAIVTSARYEFRYIESGDPKHLQLRESGGNEDVVPAGQRYDRLRIRGSLSATDHKALQSNHGKFFLVVSFRYRDVFGGDWEGGVYGEVVLLETEPIFLSLGKSSFAA